MTNREDLYSELDDVRVLAWKTVSRLLEGETSVEEAEATATLLDTVVSSLAGSLAVDPDEDEDLSRSPAARRLKRLAADAREEDNDE